MNMSMNTIRRNSGGKLTSSLLLQSSPSHHSKVYKLKVPMSYSLFPLWFTKFLYYTCLPLSLCVNCFQRTVSTISYSNNSSTSSNLEDNERCSVNRGITCTNTWFQPFWNERYLIAIGSYLYKFQPNSTTTTPINITSASTNTTSTNTTHTNPNTDKMTIKGSPLPLDQLSMSLTSQTQFGIIDHHHHHHHRTTTLPSHPQCNGYFYITYNCKTNYYATSTREDAITWINTLNQLKQETITRQMGHAKYKGYEDKYVYLDMLALRLSEKKHRIKERLRRGSRSDMMEMVNVMDLHGDHSAFSNDDGGMTTTSMGMGYYS